MKHIFSKYKLQMIKEQSAKYECNNIIDCPREIEDIATNILHLDIEPEEVLYILALDNKHKVIGMCETSRGSINNAIVHPREVFKRLIIMNAKAFVVVHNHPSGSTVPSQSDFQTCEALKEGGEFLNILMLDFCIVGDDFLSFKQEGYI